MGIEKNVGGLDRIARGVLGVALLAVALGAVLQGRLAVATVAVITGAGLLFNAATQFCSVNALFGVDTCSQE
jgi:hypothetical protein